MYPRSELIKTPKTFKKFLYPLLKKVQKKWYRVSLFQVFGYWSAARRERARKKIGRKEGETGEREDSLSHPYPTPRCFFSAHFSLRCPLKQASTVCEGFHLNNHTKDSLKWSWKVITAAFFTFWHVSRVDSRYLTLLGKGRQKWRPSVRTSARVLLKWLKKSTLSAINTLSNKYSPIWGNFSSA